MEFLFKLVGFRNWLSDKYAKPPIESVLTEIPSDAGNGEVANAINIYVTPLIPESTYANGFVPQDYRNVIIIGGKRAVKGCGTTTTTSYEIAKSNVLAHEVGHSLGLSHTFENRLLNLIGDDGLEDTPKDYVTSNACTNPTNCQFVPNCPDCNVSTNPTTNMINFMSYTIPTCMSSFSNMQVDLIKYTLNNSMSYVAESNSFTGPNLNNITMDLGVNLYTVNPVSSNVQHSIFSNVDSDLLISNMNWTRTSGTSTSWGVLGPKNINSWFYLGSGQNITLRTMAIDRCGTKDRTLTFTAQSGFKIYSSTNITQKLTVEFDNVSYAESLPQSLNIFDEKSAKEEKVVDVKKAFDSGYFKNTNKFDIDVSGISRGVKILQFIYLKNLSSNEKSSNIETKTERVIFTN